jgi:hypothetical protein
MVVALTDRPVLRASAETREKRAAVVLRDNVSPIEKWGSRMFTFRRAQGSYDRVWYFTQRYRGDQHSEFVSALDEATRTHESVDVILLAHTNTFVEWVEELPPELRQHLRLVYNTGCRNVSQGSRWLALGAESYVGHPGVSASPVFYYFILRRWTGGLSLERSVADSWQSTRTALIQTAPLYERFRSLSAVLAETEPHCSGDQFIQIGQTMR